MSGNEDGQDSGTEQPRPETPDVAPQLAVVEFRRVFSSLPFFGSGGDGNLGKTSFEAHRLNQMIDLVENARPSDLERAGDALWKAGGAIRRAAEELSGHIERVDWEGESGDSFRRWGKKLVTNSRKLAEYSETAGTQIKASGAGLATVQKAMPPRDSRLVQKDVDDIPAPARVKGNQEYDEAAKVEEDRQEAINQMNRLGSYYTVSHEVMAGLEPPTFGPMPDPGVPRSGGHNGGSAGSGGETNAAVPAPVSTGGEVGSGIAVTPQEERVVSSAQVAPMPVVPEDRSVATELDSVAAPHAPGHETAPSASVSPATGGSAPGSNAAPYAAGFGNPGGLQRGLPRATSGISGTPRAAGAGPVAGRPGTAAGQTAAVGRPTGMTGQPSGVAGRQAGTATGMPPGGRAGQPMSGSAVGRGSGIVGGAPSSTGARAMSPRLPRGTVIGAAETGIGRGPSGAVGSTILLKGTDVGSPGGKADGRRPVSGSGGIIGAPRAGASAQSRVARDFTPGGSGLVRAATVGRAAGANSRNGAPSARQGDDEEGSRPDYLTEDEETWTSAQRRVVPPVVE